MREVRAYFTPDAEVVSKLADGLLFGAPESARGVDFMISVSGDVPADRLPDLEEVTLQPVTSVCVSEEGFEVTGSRKDNPTAIGRLAVDITVEPPRALYRETVVNPAED